MHKQIFMEESNEQSFKRFDSPTHKGNALGVANVAVAIGTTVANATDCRASSSTCRASVKSANNYPTTLLPLG